MALVGARPHGRLPGRRTPTTTSCGARSRWPSCCCSGCASWTRPTAATRRCSLLFTALGAVRLPADAAVPARWRSWPPSCRCAGAGARGWIRRWACRAGAASLLLWVPLGVLVVAGRADRRRSACWRRPASAANLMLAGEDLEPWRGDLTSTSPFPSSLGLPGRGGLRGWPSRSLVGRRPRRCARRRATARAGAGRRDRRRRWSLGALLPPARPTASTSTSRSWRSSAPLLLVGAPRRGWRERAGRARRAAAARGRRARAGRCWPLAVVGAPPGGRRARPAGGPRDARAARRGPRRCPPAQHPRWTSRPAGASCGPRYYAQRAPAELAPSPLLGTTYPHVPGGRQARLRAGRPPRERSAAGPTPTARPLWQNGTFRLYRDEARACPGRDHSSRTMVDDFRPACD